MPVSPEYAAVVAHGQGIHCPVTPDRLSSQGLVDETKALVDVADGRSGKPEAVQYQWAEVIAAHIFGAMQGVPKVLLRVFIASQSELNHPQGVEGGGETNARLAL